MRQVPGIFRHSGIHAAAAVATAAVLAGAFTLAGPVASASAAVSSVAGTHPQWAVGAADRRAVAADTQIETTVYLAGRDEAGLNAYASEVADPGSPLYHKYLTPSQFSARFGATGAQVSQVEGWLRSAGLRVTGSNGHAVTVSGTAAATERAYGVGLDDYAVDGGSFRAPTADARIPASVATAVLTVTGLDNAPAEEKPAGLLGQQTTPTVPGISKTPATRSIGADGSVYLGPSVCSGYYGQVKDTTDLAFDGKTDNPYAVCGYVPSQVRGAYGVTGSGLTGKGATVAVVDAYASPTMPADANQYSVNHGEEPFAAGQYREIVTPSQWTDEPDCGYLPAWSPEESLDVEAVHAMAPDATVLYYGADSCDDADFLAVLAAIVDTHAADIVSDSWGSLVYSKFGDEDPSVIAEYTQIFEQGSIEGIGFTFSTGDCGAEDPQTACGYYDASATPQADFPSSDPYVTSVGGTSLAIGAQNQAEWNTVWGTDVWILGVNDRNYWFAAGYQYGGGGGASALFAQPSYQQGVVSKTTSDTLPDATAAPGPMRVTPDVSMDADPTTGFLMGMTQQLPDGGYGYAESAVGGTSLASPLFAGLEADAIQAQHGVATGFANPAIYALAGTPAFTDVTGTGLGVKSADIIAAPDLLPEAFKFGDDDLLRALKGYDDATGLGTPSARYLASYGG
jgi:subtilase family serine protease